MSKLPSKRSKNVPTVRKVSEIEETIKKALPKGRKEGEVYLTIQIGDVALGCPLGEVLGDSLRKLVRHFKLKGINVLNTEYAKIGIEIH